MVLGPQSLKSLTADIDLDRTCVGVAGMPRAGMVTPQATNRDVSSIVADPIGVWSQVFNSSSANAMRRKNGIENK